jgi:DNA ligase (NAD+)
MGKRSAEKLLAAIETSKSRGMARLLNALSIRHVGTTVANVLARHFSSINRLRLATEEELSQVNEIGTIIAKSVANFLTSPYGNRVLDDLAAIGIKFDRNAADEKLLGNQLAGKSIVVTGSLNKYTRDEIERLIEQHGGKSSSSVSSKTHFLVAGEKAGSKLEKAKSLGVTVLSEEEFESLIST